MMRTYFIRWLSILILLLANVPVTAAEKLVSIATRPGVTQSFLLLEARHPVANIVLFAGGHGDLGIQDTSGHPVINWGKNNFLVRTRAEFLAHGFTVVVIDAPSDRQTDEGMFNGFRTSREHVIDIDAVIAFLRHRNHLPVWLVGTSRGTESAAYIMIHSTQSPDGLVLTSSMTEENNKGIPLVDMALDRITRPVMLVTNKDDDCWVTLPSENETLKQMLTHATRVELKYYQGGAEPQSSACQAMSAHGYLGIENQVVHDITDFIFSQSAPEK